MKNIKKERVISMKNNFCEDDLKEKALPDKEKAGHGKVWKSGRRSLSRLFKTFFRKKQEGYEDIFIFVPGVGQIIRMAEGSSDNLLSEDMENGYVDYIYYEQYELGAGIPEVDGGQILLDELLRDRYCRMAECIPDVLDLAYGNRMIGFMILD